MQKLCQSQQSCGVSFAKQMKLINPSLLERFDAFVNGITSSDNVAIYHDSDPDGTCAGVIVAKAIETLTGKKVLMHVGANKNHRFVSTAFADELKKARINKLISVDIACEEKPEGLFIAENFADILVIDHHKVYNDLKSSKRITLIKSQLLYDMPEPSKYCAAKLTYDLMSRHVNLKDCDWLSVVGLIGDICADFWFEFIQSVFSKLNIEMKKDLFDTKLGMIARTVSSAEVYSEKNVSICFKMLYKAKNPDDVLNSKLSKFRTIIEDEINYYVSNAEKLAEFYNDIELVFYEINPKYAIKSPLCTIVAFKYPKQTVIVVTKEKGMHCISARRQDKKIAMNNLLEECTKGFENSNAGGHSASAGAAFPSKYFTQFKKRILAELKKSRLENRKI